MVALLAGSGELTAHAQVLDVIAFSEPFLGDGERRRVGDAARGNARRDERITQM